MKIVKLFIMLIILVSFSCATSRGSLFENTAGKSSAASQTAVDTDTYFTDNTDTENDEGLTITSTPYGCDVFIDHEYMGTTPLTLTLDTGKYKIVVIKKGYYHEARWINYTSGENREIDFILKQITGYLYLETEPSGTKVKADGSILDEGVNELPIGRYQIDADLFGYNHFSTRVFISEKETTKLFITMKPADFEFSDLRLTRSRFNPDNPSGLGLSRITFTVSTYGKGKLSIYSPSGDVVLTHLFPLFSDWNQSFTWKGRDGYGKPLADGTYKIVLTGKDESGERTDIKTAYAVIDHSIIIKNRNVFSGAAGTLFSPTPDLLPEGNLQVTLSSIGHIEGAVYRFPSTAALRITPWQGFETDISGGIIIQSPRDNDYIFSLSGKKEIIRSGEKNPFSLSGILKGTYTSTYIDTMYNFTGLSVSFPAGITSGPFTMVITPDITFSPYRASFFDEETSAGFYLMGYGRGAVLFDFGPVWTGISGSVRTIPFSEGFGIDYPVSAGIEFHWILPGTGIILSGYITGDFYSDGGYYISTGGGAGLIN